MTPLSPGRWREMKLLQNSMMYPNAIENSSETLPMYCHRQMLKTLSVTNENVIQIIQIKSRNKDTFIKSLG